MSGCEAFWREAARLTCFLITRAILLLWLALPLSVVGALASAWAEGTLCIGTGIFGVDNPITRFLDYSTLPLFFHYLCTQFSWFPSFHPYLYVPNMYVAGTALIGITPLRSLLSLLATAEDVFRAGGFSLGSVMQETKAGMPDCSQSLEELKKQLENLTSLVEAKMQAEERKA